MTKRGPKPKPENQKKEGPTSLRLTPGLRERLEAAAKKNGTTFSEEMIARLEASFSDSRQRVDELGGFWTYSLLRLIVIAFEDVKRETGHHWHGNAYSFHHATSAISEILGCFKPKGASRVPDDHPLLLKLRGMGASKKMLLDAAGQLEKFEAGRIAGMNAVFMMEMSDQHPDSPYHEQFREIAKRLKPRLSKKGKAQGDILSLDHNDPRWSVKG